MGTERSALLAEAAAVARCGADIVEWRADFFGAIGDTAEAIDTARAVRAALPGMPLLFTCRCAAEGGNPVSISEKQVVDLYAAICASGQAELIDYEMSNEGESIRSLRAQSRQHGVGLILSSHDFQRTPPLHELVERFRRARALDADVAKVAVMPRSQEDVLTLLMATLAASRSLEIPLISMSMGALGALTRIVGFSFGSALTFGVAAAGSAPGQIPIQSLRAQIESLQRTLGA